MKEETERARQEVLDWLRGRGSTIVLALLGLFVVMFILAGAGAL